MNSEKKLKWASRLLDGELDPPRAERLRPGGVPSALEENAEREWRALGDHLRAQPIPVPPAEVLWQDVHREIRKGAQEHWVHQHLRVRWDWEAVAASVVFIVALGYFGLKITSPVPAYAEPARVEWVEAELPGSSAMVYEDDTTGVVVIWLITPDANAAPGGNS